MPDLALVTGSVRRSRGNLPEVPLINVFSEGAVTEPTRFALQSFPGLAAEGTTMGAGPVHAVLKKDGVLSGALVGVSGSSFYLASTLLGAISVPGPASIAGNEIGAIATGGSDAVFWDGSDYSAVSFPDGAAVRKVFEQGGRFLFLRDGSQAFYWTDPLQEMLDGNGEIVIDGLNFASAESEPDQLLDGLAMEDALVLGGTATIEFWSKTGDEELPYVPSTGRVFQKGLRATGCLAQFDNSFGWVSPDNIVYRAGNVPERISDSGIEERIAASTECRVDSYFFEGHEFLKVALDDTALHFDAQTRQWCERKTAGGPFWGGAVAQGPIFGSNIDGTIYEHATDRTDVAGSYERRFRAGAPINGGALKVHNCRLRTNPGHTDYLGGDYIDPPVEIRLSRDGGMTFSSWRSSGMGRQGDYRNQVEWRALGLADAPGFLAEFRVTSPIDWRVSGVAINERAGGRSR